MQYVSRFIHFLQGTYAKFGTSANLIREVTLSVLTAVAVAVLVQLLSPEPSPVSEVLDLVNRSVAQQHEIDSLRNEQKIEAMKAELDSLRRRVQPGYTADSAGVGRRN